jgi:hypothetical protein
MTLKRVRVPAEPDPVLCGEIFPEDARHNVCVTGWALNDAGPPRCVWVVGFPAPPAPPAISDHIIALMLVRVPSRRH